MTDIDAEWESLAAKKEQLNEQLANFMHDREILEKDLLEFKTCKEAQDKATIMTIEDFKRTQANIVQSLELREF